MPAIPDDEATPDEEALDPRPDAPTLSDLVRESPVGALIGAFVVGFLVARLL